MENRREIIIMIDDDIANLAVMKNNLIDKYDILTVPSGIKLFKLLEKVTPALILLNIDISKMDGYKVIKILKSSAKTAHIPIILLTTNNDPESKVKGLSYGACDYITKPFSRELFIKRIDLYILFEIQKKELLNYNLNLGKEVSKKTESIFELQYAILKTVAELVECRDNVTREYIDRTQHHLSMSMNFLLEHGVYAYNSFSWMRK